MRTLAIAPTYLESENVVDFLRRVRAAAPSVDVLVVDDNSADGTADLAEAAAVELGRIEVLRRPAKMGLGSAYRSGFTIGIEKGYEALVQMDADLSHDPAALPSLLQEIDASADLAIGSRYVPGGQIPHWPWFRRALSTWGNRYAAAVLGMRIHDCTSGFRAYRAGTLKAIDFTTTRSSGYGIQIELAYRIARWGGRVVEVPIVFTDRVRGRSKMNWRIALEELALVTWWGTRDRWRGRRERRNNA